MPEAYMLMNADRCRCYLKEREREREREKEKKSGFPPVHRFELYHKIIQSLNFFFRLSLVTEINSEIPSINPLTATDDHAITTQIFSTTNSEVNQVLYLPR
ncbi:hypothetical protein EYC80_002278 [Monilinia laxa]|uniref:Uncharacterized protein n=1 Tax=Monilinia laxa TaxID=61186 RepID=A0A5N6K3L1_MONLA|nr:hypothetical protein EYC80_002278 [Monilinia laxa]